MKKLRMIGALVLLLMVLALGTWRLANSRTYMIFGEPIPRVNTSQKVVALTFDDGPTKVNTEAVLTILKEENVQATFFVIGSDLEKNPLQGQEIVAAGHELGNHSYSHQRMVFKSPAFIKKEIQSTDEIIRKTGYQGDIYFRMPFCKKLVYLPYYLKSTGRKTITWDIEPETYPEIAASAQNITEYVVANVKPGSIILLHPMYQSRAETRKALKPMIQQLKGQGYQFVTVAELLKK